MLNVKLQTKNQRAITKPERLRKEMERLQRANSYISDDPRYAPYYERNLARISDIKKELGV